ncbi:MAG: hypothetical protein ACERLM_13395, partial [Acidimicrobiales bacterium]
PCTGIAVSDEQPTASEYRWARQVSALLLIAVVVVIVGSGADIVVLWTVVDGGLVVGAVPTVSSSPQPRALVVTRRPTARATRAVACLPMYSP